MPVHTFTLNGKQVSVDCEDDVRLLWVLRDLLGVTGPKYGCGLGVCKACTSHINGKAFNPCSVSVSNIKPTDEIAMAMMPIIPKMLSNCVMKAFAVLTSKLFGSENLTCRRVRKISST